MERLGERTRINRILDVISSYGYEIERGVCSMKQYNSIDEYQKAYSKLLDYELLDVTTQTFHIKEIKDWVFNIELREPKNEWEPEAIVWGLWIPLISDYQYKNSPFCVELRLNNDMAKDGIWDNDRLIKYMLANIIKNKWLCRYCSYIGHSVLFSSNGKYMTNHKAKRIVKKALRAKNKESKKVLYIKNYINSYSIPVHKFKNEIKNPDVVISSDKDYFTTIYIKADEISDKYKENLEKFANKNNAKLIIEIKEHKDK